MFLHRILSFSPSFLLIFFFFPILHSILTFIFFAFDVLRSTIVQVESTPSPFSI
jgi:hypothetical protein